MDNMHCDLSRARLEQSKQCIKSAMILAENGDYRGAANRSYYAIFHAMRSVLALDGKDFAKHAGVISCFRRDYIKNGDLPRELSPIITSAFDEEIRGIWHGVEKCDNQQQFYVSAGDGKAGTVQAANRENPGYKNK